MEDIRTRVKTLFVLLSNATRCPNGAPSKLVASWGERRKLSPNIASDSLCDLLTERESRNKRQPLIFIYFCSKHSARIFVIKKIIVMNCRFNCHELS